MPRKPEPVSGDEKKEGASPLLSALREYLIKVSPKKSPKMKKKTADKKAERKVFVKKMKVRMPKKKSVKKASEKTNLHPVVPHVSDSSIIPEIEKSLQEYISRRSVYLNRAASAPADTLVPRQQSPEKTPEATDNKPQTAGTQLTWINEDKTSPSEAGRPIGTLHAVPKSEPATQGPTSIPDDELIPVAKPTEAVYAPVQTVIEEHETVENIPASSIPAEMIPDAPRAPNGINRLLRYLPFFSSTVLDTAKKTEELQEKLKKNETETRTMAERIKEAEKKMAAWSQPPPPPAEPAVPQRGATIVPVQTIVVNKTVVNPITTIGVANPGTSTVNVAGVPTVGVNGVNITAVPTTSSMANASATAATQQQLAAEVQKEKSGEITPEDRKKAMEDDEKRAEILMMKAAKKAGPKKSSFFAEFSASMQYLGMAKQRLSMIQNLATMLNAGLPLVDALRTLQMETKNKASKKLLRQIMLAVDNGSPLWRAMDEQHFFSPHAIALIRIGEEAGNLAENMQYLAAQQEKDQALKEKVQMAMIYPTIVMVLMFAIVIGLGTFVLPNLIGVLRSLNADLPFATIMLIRFTDGFTTYGNIVIPSLIGFLLLLAFLAKFTRFKIVTQWIVFRIPGIGKLAREATLARFGVILGGLLQAGVPLVEALKSLVEVTPTVAYKNFYRRLLDHVNGGDSFARSFTVIRGTNDILPVSIQQLVITGEKTGTLAQIMLKISEIYEKEANNTAQKLPVILEPLILLFIGALVGTIAFAIIIPIYSIVGKVGK